eukprot:9485188-Alexandrium_andersonii.AAC.1
MHRRHVRRRTSSAELAQRVGFRTSNRPAPPFGGSVFMPNQHMCPTPLSTPGRLRSPRVSSVPHEAADAGCSCKKCAPRAICASYNLMTKLRWVRASCILRSTSSGSMRGWFTCTFKRAADKEVRLASCDRPNSLLPALGFGEVPGHPARARADVERTGREDSGARVPRRGSRHPGN